MRGIFADIGISLFIAVLIILELTLLVLSLAVIRTVGMMQRLMRTVGEGDFSASEPCNPWARRTQSASSPR